MFEVPGSMVSSVFINEQVVRGQARAEYIVKPTEVKRDEVDAEEEAPAVERAAADESASVSASASSGR